MKGRLQTVSSWNWPFIAGVGFFVLVVLGLFRGYFAIVDWLMDEKAVPLRHVAVTGKLTHIDSKIIAAAVMKGKVGSFFSVDVNQVQQRIKALPWVYDVSVRKKWPDVLNVHVTEQQAVAMWNDSELINVHGEVFSPDLSGTEALPKLYGPQGSAGDALEGFRDMHSLLSINGFTIDKLSLSARFSWQVALGNGTTVALGREDTVQRLQRFIDLYGTISRYKEDARIERVDLRYDTGMAVQWAKPDDNGNKATKT